MTEFDTAGFVPDVKESPCEFIRFNKHIMEAMLEETERREEEVLITVDNDVTSIDIANDFMVGEDGSIDVRELDIKGKVLIHTHPGDNPNLELSLGDIKTALARGLAPNSVCFIASTKKTSRPSIMEEMVYGCFTPDTYRKGRDLDEVTWHITGVSGDERVERMREFGSYCEGRLAIQ
jgi:hypothetical protein